MSAYLFVIPGRGRQPANPESRSAFGLAGFRVRRLASFFTSPCKGEVGRAAAGWGSLGLCTKMTPSLTLPLSGGGNTPDPLIKSQLLWKVS